MMPIYEYRCRKCHRRFSVLTLRVSERPRVLCTHCGSRAAERLMSRFAMPKSEEARLEALADPSRMGDLDEKDPRSIARWMKNVGREMGEDLSGEDVDEMIESMESGEDGEAGSGDDDL